VTREFRPGIDLVPEPLWGKNLRATQSQSKWRALRKRLIDERGLKCAMCGAVESDAKKIHAHEQWLYVVDANAGVGGEAPPSRPHGTAKLVGIELICGKCHAVEHFGRLRVLKKRGEIDVSVLESVIAHFCKTNGATVDEFLEHEERAVVAWRQLNEIKDWSVDVASFIE
jgi:hypothetical protein